MHNKAFVADNQVFIVGGRNIGNEYFGAGRGIQFADIGVIGVGAAVREVSREFDWYWNSASAYPAASIVPAGTALTADELQTRFAAVRADPEARAYLDAVYADPQVQELLAAKVPFEWTTVQLLYDDPAKTLDTEERRELRLYPQLRRALGMPTKSLELISPYFVPGDDGTALLVALAKNGVRVRVLTNSLASTDEIPVHAGYAPRRRELLAAGVQLYELKPTAAQPVHKSRARFGLGSASALHAKSVAVDRERIFVGSYNLDRRSGELNTEMGLVIDSPSLAGTVAEAFDTEIPAAAYEVRLAPDGRSLIWIERTASGEEIRHDTEPGTTWAMRFEVDLLSILPFEWML
jgi:putative cardiolipin synthase